MHAEFIVRAPFAAVAKKKKSKLEFIECNSSLNTRFALPSDFPDAVQLK